MAIKGIDLALTTLAASLLFDPPVTPIRIRQRGLDEYRPILHPTKGWRGTKKKHRSKFKRRGRKS